MMLACLTALLSGCVEPIAPTDLGPLFCDVEEPRVFPDEAYLLDRIENDRENLIRDVRTNETYEARC